MIWFIVCFLPVVFEFKDAYGYDKTVYSSNRFRDTFESWRFSGVFVDKTMMIEDFFKKPQHLFVTAPSGFGKSHNFDMLKAFAEIVICEKQHTPRYGTETDAAGNTRELPVQRLNKNYLIFKSNNLTIYTKRKEFFQKHCGRYPIIMIDFKPIESYTFDNFLTDFKIELTHTFNEHDYLYLSCCSDNVTHPKITQFIKDIYTRTTEMTAEEVLNGLKILPEAMFKYFNKKAMVMVEDFDSPIEKLLFNKLPQAKAVMEFIKKVFDVLLGSEYVDRSYITANSRLVWYLGDVFKNVTMIPFLGNHEYVKYFGLTKQEVVGLFSNYENISHTIEEVASWYNGYVSSENLQMFTTSSVINYLFKGTLKSHWIEETERKRNLETRILYDNYVKKTVEEMLNNKTRIFKVIQKMNAKHFENLELIVWRIVVGCEDPVFDNEFDIFFQLLFERGYFTMLGGQTHGDSAVMKVANNEVAYELRKMVYG